MTRCPKFSSSYGYPTHRVCGALDGVGVGSGSRTLFGTSWVVFALSAAFSLSHGFLGFCFHCYPLVGCFGSVTGALSRKTDPKITTSPRLKVEVRIK